MFYTEIHCTHDHNNNNNNMRACFQTEYNKDATDLNSSSIFVYIFIFIYLFEIRKCN
jgi:abortive infection bacteriophage resistance protein